MSASGRQRDLPARSTRTRACYSIATNSGRPEHPDAPIRFPHASEGYIFTVISPVIRRGPAT